MKNKKILMPLFSFVCFLVVALSPVFLSFKDSYSVTSTSESIGSATHSYIYSDVGLKFLETSIAQANGLTDYASPSENIYIHFDIDKIKDIDLSCKTIYISGKVAGTWVPNSIGKMSIANSSEYNSMKFAG